MERADQAGLVRMVDDRHKPDILARRLQHVFGAGDRDFSDTALAKTATDHDAIRARPVGLLQIALDHGCEIAREILDGAHDEGRGGGVLVLQETVDLLLGKFCRRGLAERILATLSRQLSPFLQPPLEGLLVGGIADIAVLVLHLHAEIVDGDKRQGECAMGEQRLSLFDRLLFFRHDFPQNAIPLAKRSAVFNAAEGSRFPDKWLACLREALLYLALDQESEAAVQETITADMLFERLDREPDRWALFLDIDGTLIDLALTPDLVIVPQELPAQVMLLSQRLGGALALVTGRALADADNLFHPLQLPAAGLHGAEVRLDGKLLLRESGPEFDALKQALAAKAAAYPGVLIEDKGAAVAAHFRLAPQFEAQMQALMSTCAEQAGPDWALQFGKMVIELRPAGANKGNALERFLKSESFGNRLPVAIGDDLTDEAMFAIANSRGGLSFRVGLEEGQTCASGRLPSPASVRDLVARLAAGAPSAG